jgi:hypothetical protein
MTSNQPLKPNDFPVHVDDKDIVKVGGKPIAKATDNKTARDVAERLNDAEARSEEDRWA